MCGQRQWVASPAPPLVRAAVETAHVCAVVGCTAEATQAVFEAAVDAVTGDPILRPHALLPYLCASHAGSGTGTAELTWRGRHRLAHLGRMVSLVARLPESGGAA
jgi:hypothetical protein